jgi:ferrochelatase
VLVNLGTVESPTPEGVRAFLEEFLSDPLVVDYPRWLWRPVLNRILRTRPVKVAEMYKTIWSEEGSPLKTGTRRLAQELGRRTGAEVRFAFRYGAPSLHGEVESSRGVGCTVVPLFPQRTGSTTGTIEGILSKLARASDALAYRIQYIEPDDRGYVEALADACREAFDEDSAPAPEHLVVSFHGIPKRYDRAEGGRYRRDCEVTFSSLLERLSWSRERATLSFQSRFGPEPWIGPATADVLSKLGMSGVRSVAVTTPGFLTEGLETVEEIGIRGRRTFLQAGGERFVRVPAIEAHPFFVASLAEALSRAAEQPTAIGDSSP